MTPVSLAVCADDFRLEVKAALNRARALGFRAVDLSAVTGPISPAELSATGRRHFARHMEDMGLRLASLRGPADGAGYDDPTAGERRLDQMRGIVRLASELRVPVVSTAMGRPVRQPEGVIGDRAREALAVLADDADRFGVRVALETAGISASALNELLRELNCPYLASCCDAGAMLMQGEDPHHVAEALPGRIALVRARDAVAGAAGAVGHETALGEGQLNPAAFLAALTEAGFGGDMILTRTTAARPELELARARAEFEKYLP
ncbi:MAG: hypothetical protein DCC65_06485 [Planctomycetota bacterium]|nr:MAG: hypothetical protein DCC65_06485 [Planctomycetota bacterium]